MTAHFPPVPVTAPRWPHRTWLMAMVAVVLLIKFVLLLGIGPGVQPDTAGYTAFAERLLGDQTWMTDAGLADEVIPTTAFRAIGYPALIAGAMAITPEAWPWLLIVLQLAVSGVAISASFLLAIRLGLRPAWAAGAVLAIATSLSLAVDQVILTDSLSSSLLTIVIIALAVTALDRRPLGTGKALVLGLVLAAAFLVRDGTAVLSVLLVALIGVCVLHAPRGSRGRSLLAGLILFLPLVAASQALQSWNEHRTGHRFVTTGGQTVYLFALVKAARHDPAVLGGDDAFNATARATLRDHSFQDVGNINIALFEQGLTALQIADAAKRHFAQAWREHPAAMARVIVGHLRENLAMLPVRPLDSLRETVFWVTGDRIWPSYSDLKRSSRLADKAVFVGGTMERIAGITVFAFFLIGIPVWAVARRATLLAAPSEDNVAPHVLVVLWSVFLGYFLAHALVHVETRYLAPVLPLAIIGGAAMLQRAGRAFRTSRRLIRPA